MTLDRSRLRDTIKYLRNVRPIDPEEIREYLPRQPHPGVVREAIRDESFDLGILERSDGTFVPADESPVPLSNWQPEAFPETYCRALENVLVERYGPDWHRGESGDSLRGAIRQLKEDYYRGRDVTYDSVDALGYAIYHLPDFYASVGYVLDTLTERGMLDRRLRVVDIGAGTGGPALGLHDYLPDDAVVDYHAVEPSTSVDILDRLLEETHRNFRTTIHEVTAESFDPAELGHTDEASDIDLLMFANVLSELEDPEAVVRRYLGEVSSDGTCLLLAPADLQTSTTLRTVERAVAPAESENTVYAPDLRLWPGHDPSDRGWSFDEHPELDTPGFQRQLDTPGGGRGVFVNTSVRFSYAVLRRDGIRRFEVHADPAEHAKMAETERHVTNRVDLLAVKLSHDLKERKDGPGSTQASGNEVFLIGDGSQTVDHYTVRTQDSPLNQSLENAAYGTVLAFENVLVLWNQDEGAYNLVVDGETVVDTVAGPPSHHRGGDGQTGRSR